MAETFLDISDLNSNPFTQFRKWYEEATQKMELACAMSLCTIDSSGFPDDRTVLLKDFDENGFVFYTNYNSVKGQSLKANPKSALKFYWQILNREVRIQGTAHPVTTEQADAYFATRPRLSQIAAWASLQSEILDTRTSLEKRFEEYSKKFEEQKIPRPKHWSGFCIVPHKIEFWQDRANRMHDRFRYTLKNKQWIIERLYP